VGFAYVSDVTLELSSRVSQIEITDEYNIIAEYPIGITTESRYAAEALDFINLVKSEEGRAVLERYGFSPVLDSVAASEVSGTTEEPMAAA